MEHDIGLQLERELAELLHPEARVSYSENGDYWYMNHASKPMPNFLGYVPKWSRDNAASFEIMVEHNCFPIRMAEGIAVLNKTHNKQISYEAFFDHMDSFQDIGSDERKAELKATRFAVLRAVIYKLKKLKASSKKGGSK